MAVPRKMVRSRKMTAPKKRKMRKRKGKERKIKRKIRRKTVALRPCLV